MGVEESYKQPGKREKLRERATKAVRAALIMTILYLEKTTSITSVERKKAAVSATENTRMMKLKG